MKQRVESRSIFLYFAHFSTDVKETAMPLDPADTKVNSLWFRKPPAETRVLVAMSGGVDSSVVVELHAKGYDVVGVTLQLYDHGAALARKVLCRA